MRKTFVFTFFLLAYTTLYSQPCSNLFGCNEQFQTEFFTTRIPGYECEITYEFQTRSCPNPLCPDMTILETILIGMEWDTDTTCDLLDLCVWPNYPLRVPTNYECLDMMRLEGFRAYSRKAFEDYYNSLPEIPPAVRALYHCIGNPCQFTENVCLGFSHKYYTPKCYSYSICGSTTSPTLMVRVNECQSLGTGCCITQISQCYCVATGEYKSYELHIDFGVACDPGMPIPPPDCPPGFIIYNQSPCRPECKW